MGNGNSLKGYFYIGQCKVHDWLLQVFKVPLIIHKISDHRFKLTNQNAANITVTLTLTCTYIHQT